MNSWHASGGTPPPELLAALADGELDHCPRLRQDLEDWLQSHPDAAARVDAQRAMRRLLAETTPPEPDDAVWSKVWQNVHQTPVQPRPALAWRLALASTAAAAAIAIFMLSRHFQTAVPPPPPSTTVPSPLALAEPPVPQNEVLQVARPDEVIILQVAGADAVTIVNGKLPLVEPALLVQAHEIEIRSPPCPEDAAEIRLGANNSPVLWTSLPGNAP